MVGEIGIDWKSAAIRDGTLKVAFSESAPKSWVQTVDDVVERLARSGQSWGDLESGLLQANRDLEPDDEDGEDEDLSDADRRMTETFRAFAGDS